MSMRYAGCVLTLECLHSKGLYGQSHWTLVHLTLSRGIWSLAIPASEQFGPPPCMPYHPLIAGCARLGCVLLRLIHNDIRTCKVRWCCVKFCAEAANSGQAACRWMPRPIDEHEARKSFLLPGSGMPVLSKRVGLRRANTAYFPLLYGTAVGEKPGFQS